MCVCARELNRLRRRLAEFLLRALHARELFAGFYLSGGCVCARFFSFAFERLRVFIRLNH